MKQRRPLVEQAPAVARPVPRSRPQLHLAFVASDMVRLIRADFALRTKRMPLSPALHRLLMNVDLEPGCRQVELAEWLGVTPVTVSRMLDRLEQQKLVRREGQPDDRRVSRVFVGTGATQLLARLNVEAQKTFERAFKGMTQAQRTGLLHTLGRIRENLSAQAPAVKASRTPRKRVRPKRARKVSRRVR
jgi:MarR family transcriptional regulator, transcriptional regulator for hemolysin